MDPTQERMERAVGDEFVKWLNEEKQSSFAFLKRGDPAPDLVYTDGPTELNLEISSAYYDSACAIFQWQNARSLPNAPAEWSGANFEGRLVRNIGEVVGSKPKKAYGDNCSLVIFVRPDLTSYDELVFLLQSVVLPPASPFVGIYILGYFAEGYRVIPIKPA